MLGGSTLEKWMRCGEKGLPRGKVLPYGKILRRGEVLLYDEVLLCDRGLLCGAGMQARLALLHRLSGMASPGGEASHLDTEGPGRGRPRTQSRAGLPGPLQSTNGSSNARGLVRAPVGRSVARSRLLCPSHCPRGGRAHGGRLRLFARRASGRDETGCMSPRRVRRSPSQVRIFSTGPGSLGPATGAANKPVPQQGNDEEARRPYSLDRRMRT